MKRHIRRTWARSAWQSEVGKPLRQTSAAGRPQYQRAGARPSDARCGSQGGSARPISRYTSDIREHRSGNPQTNRERRQQGEHFRIISRSAVVFAGGIIRQATVEGQKGALQRPVCITRRSSRRRYSRSRPTAHHSPRQRLRRGGLAALCVLQINLYPGQSDPADGSCTTTGAILCISSSTLDRTTPGSHGGRGHNRRRRAGRGETPAPPIARRQPLTGPF